MARRAGRRGQSGLLGTLERLGISRGVFGNSKGWFYVGTGLWTLRTVRRMAERKVNVLVSEPLKPGQRMVIANGIATIEGEPEPYRGRRGVAKGGQVAPKGRRERKAVAKAARRAERRGASQS